MQERVFTPAMCSSYARAMQVITSSEPATRRWPLLRNACSESVQPFTLERLCLGTQKGVIPFCLVSLQRLACLPKTHFLYAFLMFHGKAPGNPVPSGTSHMRRMCIHVSVYSILPSLRCAVC
jgi:hypothetical protein